MGVSLRVLEKAVNVLVVQLVIGSVCAIHVPFDIAFNMLSTMEWYLPKLLLCSSNYLTTPPSKLPSSNDVPSNPPISSVTIFSM